MKQDPNETNAMAVDAARGTGVVVGSIAATAAEGVRHALTHAATAKGGALAAKGAALAGAKMATVAALPVAAVLLPIAGAVAAGALARRWLRRLN
jgi:hypothetical protein